MSSLELSLPPPVFSALVQRIMNICSLNAPWLPILEQFYHLESHLAGQAHWISLLTSLSGKSLSNTITKHYSLSSSIICGRSIIIENFKMRVVLSFPLPIKDSVNIADGTLLPVSHCGSMSSSWILHDIFYFPSLSTNLLSVSQLALHMWLLIK